MNAEQLLQHFERISEAPDAIKRLRRFILDLAVRGKLVEQDPSDEPASELVKRITAEKARLVKAREIKNEKPLAPIEDADFDLPKSWTWTRLGKVTSYIQRGKSPKYAVNDGSLVVSQKCVQWSGLDLKVAKRITLESLIDYEKIRFLRDGDLLWNSTGTGTIGRIIKAVDPPEKLVCDSHVTVVRCLAVVPEYIRAWLRSDQVYALIEDRAAGSTNQVELTAQMAINQVVPLPPLAEQHRIVAKVDELMSLCDQLEAAKTEREQCRDSLVAASLQGLNQPAEEEETFREHARFTFNNLPKITTRAAHIKQLRQTILNLAVRGKLVEQDPSDEPAAHLLKGIGVQLIEDGAFPIPSGWAWASVGTIANARLGKMLDKAKNKGVPRPYLRNVNVRWFDFNLSDLLEMRFEEAELPEYELRDGDVLICEGGEPGRAAVWDERMTGVYFQKAIHRVRFKPFVDPVYFVYALRASADDGRLAEEFTGAGIKHFTGKGVKAYRFPLPPLAEQHLIVAKVDELMAICDQLEGQITVTEQDSRRFLESVLADALAPGIDLSAEAQVA